jgi:two-component system sensor histidine kinase BaeS
MRGRFMRRVGCFVVAALLGLLVLAGGLVWLMATVIGTHPGTILGALVVLIVVLVLARGLVSGIRGSAAPAADLIEAAGRVEGGDYGTRVPERGPRELRGLARAFNAMSSRLEADDAARRRLLADVSHELRTPLSIIQGNLEAIMDGVYPADAEHLTPILEEAHVLERLVDDLRTLSLAEAGVLRLHREPTDLGKLLHDVADGFGAQADAAGIELRVVDSTGAPPLDLDPERTRQIVGNLLANAIRYTGTGGQVTVSLAMLDVRPVVTVTDTGRGMEPEVLERIFDRFYRTPESRGSGLGLAIARSLVEAHGGEISATSRPGEGTSIRFSLPA